MTNKQSIFLLLSLITPLLTQVIPSSCGCTDCTSSYTLTNGQCINSICDTQKLKGCSFWDTNTYQCYQCLQKWYYDNNKKICLAVSPLCKTNDQKGKCLTCFQNYKLLIGDCLADHQDMTLGCQIWNDTTSKCNKCLPTFYKKNDTHCFPSYFTCKTSDQQGNCLNCYDNYFLHPKGECIINSCKPEQPFGCKIWSPILQKCGKCQEGFILQGKTSCVSKCNCKGCKEGYTPKDGQCHLKKPKPFACQISDDFSGICLKCYDGWFLNGDNRCMHISPLCGKIDDNGQCLTCIQWYYLSNGECLPQKPRPIGCDSWDKRSEFCYSCLQGWTSIPYVDFSFQCVPKKQRPKGCNTWDSFQGKCDDCLAGFSLNSVKTCVPVSPLCATNNDNGECLTCIDGYYLSNGICKQECGCSTWNWDDQICSKCKDGWLLINPQGYCINPPAGCKTYDKTTFRCTSCQTGYTICNNKCILMQ